VENVVRSHRRHRRWCTRVRLIKTHTRPFVFMDRVHIDRPRRLGRGASRMGASAHGFEDNPIAQR
jgi:hypothetical protein